MYGNELDKRLKERRGLRRKFFISVVLPPLIPFLILGLIGYFQLTSLVRSSLIEQYQRAAETTSAKLEREFSIRKTILKETSEDIFQIQDEFSKKKDDLLASRNTCIDVVSSGHPNSFLESQSCDPFLAEFARLNEDGYTSTSQITAINSGYSKQLSEFESDESEKIKDRLTAFKIFFPETLELTVFKDDKTKFKLNNTSNELDTLYVKSLKEYVVEPAVIENDISYIDVLLPLEEQSSAIVRYDLEFLKPSVDAAPLTKNSDLALVADSTGNIAYPSIDNNQERTELTKEFIADNADSMSFSYNDEKAILAQAAVIPDINWAVLMTSDSETVLAPLKNAQIIFIAAIVLSLVTSLIVGFYFVTTATNSIKKLMSGALLFANGKLDHKIIITSQDELQVLAETMNDMAAQIKKAEQKLIEKNNEFIHIATHELKAPLTSIVGYLSMIIDDGMGKVDEQAKKMVKQAFDSTSQLKMLINDMLDLAKLESGKYQYNPQHIDISETINNVIGSQSLPAKKKNISIEYKDDKTGKILADPAKLQIIFTNFISNAIKYNEINGSIEIGHFTKNDELITYVKDSGVGIPKEKQDKIFQKFYRAKTNKTADIKGTGLGMYLTKQFIEIMKGEVWFESKEGEGTTFFVSLPRATRE